MKILYVALAVLMCSAMATSVWAVVDDFESYPIEVALDAVGGSQWTSGNGMTADDIWGYYGGGKVVGYGGGQGAINQSEAYALSHAFAPNDGSTILEIKGQIMVTDRSIAAAAFTAIPGWSANNGWYQGEWGGADAVTIALQDGNGPVGIQLISSNFNDAGDMWLGAFDSVSIPNGTLLGQTWYDLKIELDLIGEAATGYYKETDGGGGWNLIGTVATPPTDAGDPFAANYIAIGTRRAASLDDLATSVIPEPSSLVALLAFGVPALAFMRRRR